MDDETITRRVADNESAFRSANERIEASADEIGADRDRIPFICECPSRDCTKIARLSRAEYEQVRASGNTFLVAPGHEVLQVEGVPIARLDERFEHFSRMAKIGDAGARSIELDPRSAPVGGS